jgi:ATP-dependent helicase/nuclease subunit A
MTAAMAYEHNGVRVARQRFYEIACDPRRSVAVEACAGAGKTWMLVSRILRALLDGAQPHEILAITFTKKAAGEMRKRLHEWLSQFADCGDEELREALQLRGIANPGVEEITVLRGLHARLLASGRPVQVRTFHSWFAALLRNAPLAVLEQLALPANYELLEDDKDAIELVWRRFYAAASADPDARADFEASVAAYGRSQTRRALEAVLARRLEFAFADAHRVVEDSVRPFGEQFAELGGLAHPGEALALDSQLRRNLMTAARALGRGARTFAEKGEQLERAVMEADLDAAQEALLTNEGEARKFSDRLEGLTDIRAAQDAVLRLAAARLQHEAWLHQQRMARLSRLVIATFAQLKRERGWVDMNDVEQAALTLLADPVLSGWVQERLDARTRHLLIDEFQDTNPLQWQALHAWLSAYAGAGGGAPALFIVGDPKQSIYRFRRAEPQVFRAAQDFIAEAFGGDRLSCDHTHRNAPEVLTAVNQVMVQAQDAGVYDGFRPHTTESRLRGRVLRLPRIERDAIVRAQGADELAWRDSLSEPRELPEEKLVALECRQAARWIAQQLAQGAAPGDVMVLARRRDRLAVMEEELRDIHVPAQQPEKADLCDAPEVKDLAALLDALVSPTHDLSLARALKSPLFGFGDDVLVDLALGVRRAREELGRPLSWYEFVRDDAAPPRLCEAGTQLARWKRHVDTLPPHDALAAIYAEGDVLARFGAASPAAMRPLVLARLRALLGAALDWNGGRYPTPYSFVRALRAGGMPAPAATVAGAVNLVTVHGAKGLEARIVLLLDADAEPARAESMGVLLEWPGEAPAPWRFTFLASDKRPPPCTADALAIEQGKRAREELNVLYVAMTRAIETLVISSVAPHRANDESWWARLHPLAEPVVDVPAIPPARLLARDTFTLPQLPVLATRAAPEAPGVPDSIASRIGQAMHRILETSGGTAVTEAQLRRIAREFMLDLAQAQEAARMAQRIVGGEGAWAWDASAIDWSADEVPLYHGGELLRIDRLVRRVATGEWWVLDYKSAARPEQQAALVEQMRRYRLAVGEIEPGARVHAAFLTADGRLRVVP